MSSIPTPSPTPSSVPQPAAAPPAPSAPSAPKPQDALSAVQAMGAVTLDAAMNAEIDAALQSVAAASAPAPARGPTAAGGSGRPSAIRGPRVVNAGRELRAGTVVSVGPSDVFVEFGPKELGVVSRLQWVEGDTLPMQGDRVEVVVDQRGDDGLLVCSRPGAVRKADWELLEPGQVIEARVTGVNKGGLDLEVAGHRAFMPAGQISLEHVADLSVFVGQKLKCSVSRVDRRGSGNIVLSRRDLLEAERREQTEKLKSALSEGQVVEGTVKKIMAFGAFVDIGGIDGLVHLSDLTHDRVMHGEKSVGRHVKIGEKVQVQILKLDWEGGRISLGIKQVQGDPFAAAANEVKEGAEITGRVTKILEFGAFIELAKGVEGLVHISELAWRRVGKVDDVLKPDEVVKAKVLKIDAATRRISLSIKALTPPPAPEPRPGDTSRGPRKGRGEPQGRPMEEILKDSTEMRRLREKFGGRSLKGGLS